jgi:hypothetical protein
MEVDGVAAEWSLVCAGARSSAGSFVDAASLRGIPALPSALEPIGSSPCPRLPSRVNTAVPLCLLRRID